MSFISIDSSELATVIGGGVEAQGSYDGGDGKPKVSGSVKTTPDPVKVYGKTEYLACKQQAYDQHHNSFPFSLFGQHAYHRAIADCAVQYGGNGTKPTQ
ncbi:MAG: hypothetical protein QM831_43760 [Kofleriaceae bacterium]